MPNQQPKDEFLGDIYQGEFKSQTVRMKKTDFKPWHKPRKHFLRLMQWCSETEKLMTRLNLPAGSEMRYLGLPGEDLLDLRVIKDVCPKGVQLRYLGFDDSLAKETKELNLAQHEVNSDSSIHLSSRVIKDRIEQVVDSSQMAHKYVQDYAPFDVINLDFCQSITHLAKKGVIPYLEAIRTLCDIQIKNRVQPWLLFITTRAIREQLDPQTHKKLFERIIENLRTHQNFSTALGAQLGLASQDLENDLSGSKRLAHKNWIDAYVLAISKWLLNYMMSTSYKVTVKMLPSYAYGVGSPKPDMISLAFYLEPNIPEHQDSSGLTRARHSGVVPPTESELAVDLITRVATIENVDKKFSGNPALKAKYVQKFSDLLAQLRYDTEAYKVFAFKD